VDGLRPDGGALTGPRDPATLIGLGVPVALLSPGPGGIALIALGAAGMVARRQTSRTTG
jgi:MYXO-CTERM domain-containing protein